MSPPETMVQRYVDELRAYLAVNPRAADTFVGVAGLWLRRRPTRRDELTALEQALDRLSRESLLLKRAGADGQVIYAGIVQRRNGG